jgi:hypothetical protein
LYGTKLAKQMRKKKHRPIWDREDSTTLYNPRDAILDYH